MDRKHRARRTAFLLTLLIMSIASFVFIYQNSTDEQRYYGMVIQYMNHLGGKFTGLVIWEIRSDGNDRLIDTLGYYEENLNPQFFINNSIVFRYHRQYDINPHYYPILHKSIITEDSVIFINSLYFDSKLNTNSCWMKFDKDRACLRCDSLSYIIDLENMKVIDTTRTEPQQEFAMVRD